MSFDRLDDFEAHCDRLAAVSRHPVADIRKALCWGLTDAETLVLLDIAERARLPVDSALLVIDAVGAARRRVLSREITERMRAQWHAGRGSA